MSAVYPTLPKLAVRDNLDDDDLTDIDDEVFIRDGRNGGLKLDDDGGVKRPLMAPRRKCKSCSFENQVPYKLFLMPVCCGITALIVILGLIVLGIFTANIFPMPLTILKSWLSHELKDPANKSEIIPCTSLSSKVLWTRTLPKLISEAPLRSNDVNSDGIEDIIVGFSTASDLDMMDNSEYICTVYFGNQTPCRGGVLALNGKTGVIIWTHRTAYAILSVDCHADLTNDEIKDCVISGRGGILQAINGHDGSSIWDVPFRDPSEQQIILDVSDARFIADMDGDSISDVIVSYMQLYKTQESHIFMISGKSGNIIRNIKLPDTEQLFIAPQIMVHPDGEVIFVLATTNQQDAGGLYIVSEANIIFYDNLQLRKLNYNTGKGALLPPILIDITSDGIEDIVVAMFDSIMAYNGSTFEPIWNYTVPNSEVISIPIPGYYNDDDIPDFMVQHQIEIDLSTYYYTVTTIIDGRNGQSLLEKPMENSLSGQMSGLSITVDGFGNDWFLHWSTDCLNYEGIKEKFQFLKGQSFMSQTRADLCRLRFNSTLTTRLLALNQHVGPPGLSLYFSEDQKSLEFNNSVDSRKEEEKYLNSQLKITDTYPNTPFVSERSSKVQNRKDSIFKHKDNSILEIGKYDSDAVYENVDEFKSHKKHNPEDTVENLDIDQTWKQDNKWVEDDAQSDKEYDSVYEGDNNNNEDGQQSVDYSQGEVREQRSVVTVVKEPHSINISHKEYVSKEISDYSTPESTQHNLRIMKLDHEDINITEEKGEMKEINNKKNDPVNTTDIMNISITLTPKSQEEFSSTTSSDKSNIEKITTIQSILNTSARTSELIKINITNNSTELPEDTRTKAANVTKNQTIIDHQDAISAKKVVDVTKRRQIYKHSFPNIVQDADDDASIEKVFKRESLKNQSKGKISKKQLLILSSITDKDFKIRQKRRTKRNSGTDDNRSSGINGIQRQSPTGILLPSITESKGKTSIDLVFSTFWLPSYEMSQADVECIINKKKALLENKFEYKKDDDIINECLSERGINYRLYQESRDRENTKIAFGQMTIYRMKLECVCPEDILPNQTCRDISSHQSWPEHQGSSGNGYFKPLRRLNV